MDFESALHQTIDLSVTANGGILDQSQSLLSDKIKPKFKQEVSRVAELANDVCGPSAARRSSRTRRTSPSHPVIVCPRNPLLTIISKAMDETLEAAKANAAKYVRAQGQSVMTYAPSELFSSDKTDFSFATYFDEYKCNYNSFASFSSRTFKRRQFLFPGRAVLFLSLGAKRKHRLKEIKTLRPNVSLLLLFCRDHLCYRRLDSFGHYGRKGYCVRPRKGDCHQDAEFRQYRPTIDLHGNFRCMENGKTDVAGLHAVLSCRI